MNGGVGIKRRQIGVLFVDDGGRAPPIVFRRQVTGIIHIVGERNPLHGKHLPLFIKGFSRLGKHLFAVIAGIADGAMQGETGNIQFIPEFFQILPDSFAERSGTSRPRVFGPAFFRPTMRTISALAGGVDPSGVGIIFAGQFGIGVLLHIIIKKSGGPVAVPCSVAIVTTPILDGTGGIAGGMGLFSLVTAFFVPEFRRRIKVPGFLISVVIPFPAQPETPRFLQLLQTVRIVGEKISTNPINPRVGPPHRTEGGRISPVKLLHRFDTVQRIRFGHGDKHRIQ